MTIHEIAQDVAKKVEDVIMTYLSSIQAMCPPTVDKEQFNEMFINELYKAMATSFQAQEAAMKDAINSDSFKAKIKEVLENKVN